MRDQSIEPKVKISGLYKVFGRKPHAALEQLRDGMSKDELLAKTRHVVGLSDINLDIAPHKIQVVMGLSGSGKSTLIRHINRLIEPTSGDVWIDGENVTQMGAAALRDVRRFKTSMVFQKFALLPHRTVAQNVAYGLDIQGVAEDEAAKRAATWIDRVGLAGFERHYPAQLSGGMQQRVGLARALATDAEILLMDEAFSALDPLIRADMQDILLRLQSELNKTIIFITHDLDEALRLGDSIAILRDGAMVQVGDPQSIMMRPTDDYVASFIKDINRGRMLRLSAILEPHNGADAQDIGPLVASETLETALPRMAGAGARPCIVRDASGAIVGQVSLARAIEALVQPAVAVNAA